MKRSILTLIVLGTIFTGCSTVQSIIRSTFPYTAIFVIPATSKINAEQSATSQASSFDQIFTGQASNTESIRDVRVISVKIDKNIRFFGAKLTGVLLYSVDFLVQKYQP